jgi:hypothetical protein
MKLWIPALAMAAALLAAGAARATSCVTERYVWELELDTLEKLAGPGDVAAERAALSETAELFGDTADDNHPADTGDVQLYGPDSGSTTWAYRFEAAP